MPRPDTAFVTPALPAAIVVIGSVGLSIVVVVASPPACVDQKTRSIPVNTVFSKMKPSFMWRSSWFNGGTPIYLHR